MVRVVILSSFLRPSEALLILMLIMAIKLPGVELLALVTDLIVVEVSEKDQVSQVSPIQLVVLFLLLLLPLLPFSFVLFHFTAFFQNPIYDYQFFFMIFVATYLI